ncbi:DUF1631 domain-containing protein [Pseudomonas rubra]|uniref:DUF1631 domain-containing protein n=1 Tax=Pseudomonas rubra TaxID=2942627 RepID=A0ABT5P7T9_9PSED|nr:DUF1631 domain-containing protein [Pseudomonas rubra]MDD1014360.1 DUF1631 domain-containing protein [Pseudomonas rubra]MDD1038017.1 DUF1631 domain-containing protein [Pseudomonas rubra]MDD1155450.1 DUF1631 domain-containing protein [Pseudomonas rubra]
MHNDAKVVPIKAITDQAHNAPLARLPVVLLQVRDKAALQLRQGLQALFDNADDTLFEMADKAANNVEQNILFEAMRDLRLKRKHIERGYLDHFYEAFVQIGRRDLLPALHSHASDRLALMANDELERTVALDAMVARVLARDGIALNQLTLRFGALVGQALDDPRNPLGPAMLCDYFLRAGRSLGVGIKVKLIILKLFERYVLHDTDQLYGEANQLLIATGVLPGLMAVPRRRAQDRQQAEREAAASEAGSDSYHDALDANGQAVFASLQTLLSPVRGRVAPRLEACEHAQAISTRDLLRLLSHLQHYVPSTAQIDDFDLHQQLEQLLTRVSVKSGTYRKIEVIDEDVINLIAMLFEFILADRNLPRSLRVLIGRMQIPMLKVAVLDKSFFSRSSHPARRLLNEIATAAMGWGTSDDCQRDSLYLRVEKIVQRLLSDFGDDPAIFSELLAEFLAFSTDERRRNELLEQRTRDAEEGRARTALARQRVQQELNRRLLGRSMPRVVVRLLEEAWSQVLLLACLKHGDTSGQWLAALQTMDELIWSAQPHPEEQARLRLLELVPGLLKALRDGLASAAFDPFATSEFFAQLETLHVQMFDSPRVGGRTRHNDASERVLVVDEIVLPAPEVCRPQAPQVRLADDDPALLQVERLRIGAWVELLDEEDVQRCKLIARIESSDRFIFVNRTGLKVREWSRMALAVALRRGHVRQLDDTLLFDRALDSVLSQLRQTQAR